MWTKAMYSLGTVSTLNPSYIITVKVLFLVTFSKMNRIGRNEGDPTHLWYL